MVCRVYFAWCSIVLNESDLGIVVGDFNTDLHPTVVFRPFGSQVSPTVIQIQSLTGMTQSIYLKIGATL